jgi:hypothetical protein
MSFRAFISVPAQGISMGRGRYRFRPIAKAASSSLAEKGEESIIAATLLCRFTPF